MSHADVAALLLLLLLLLCQQLSVTGEPLENGATLPGWHLEYLPLHGVPLNLLKSPGLQQKNLLQPPKPRRRRNQVQKGANHTAMRSDTQRFKDDGLNGSQRCRVQNYTSCGPAFTKMDGILW